MTDRFDASVVQEGLKLSFTVRRRQFEWGYWTVWVVRGYYWPKQVTGEMYMTIHQLA